MSMLSIKVEQVSALLDSFYKKNGPCCAGCFFWNPYNSVVGECVNTAPVSGFDRVSIIGIYESSLKIDSGHILTKRDHHCGGFIDVNKKHDSQKCIGCKHRAGDTQSRDAEQ